MMITINYIKPFYKSHRTLVSVTIHPGWFARIFLWAKPQEIAFIGWGTNWVRFYEAEDERPNIPARP